MKKQSLRVLGEDWVVQSGRMTQDDQRAVCDSVRRCITLDPEKSGREDLMHEVIHAVEYSMNLDLTEHEVQTLARGLWAALRENPWFLETFVEEQ